MRRKAQDLDLIDEDVFAFCWIVNYPMFEKDEQTVHTQVKQSNLCLESRKMDN